MRNDLQLAWRNLWRNRRRSMLSISAVVFASAILVFMLSLAANQYQLMIRASVNGGTGYLQILADDYRDDPQVWLVIPDPEAVIHSLDGNPRVRATTVRSEGFSLLAGKDHALGAMVIGIDPETESRVTTVADTVREGTFLKPEEFDRAVIGGLLARNLGIGAGDTVTLLGSARDGSIAAGDVVIQGLFETGQPEVDRSTLYVGRAFFDEVFRMEGAVHRILIRSDSLWWLAEPAREIEGKVSGLGTKEHPLVTLTWRELLPGLLEGIELDMLIGGVMYLILVLVVAFSILNTFIMAVYERTREFGVMMAIGTTPWRLVRVLMLESGLLTLAGVLTGIALGSIITLYFARVGIDFGEEAAAYMVQYGLPPRAYPELSPVTATLGPSVVLVVTLLAALLPVLKIRRLRPVEAIHTA
ncbi:MAG: FtsX-like permease family protein [Opitutaceae bacterium]